jgi:hypothetical protein
MQQKSLNKIYKDFKRLGYNGSFAQFATNYNLAVQPAAKGNRSVNDEGSDTPAPQTKIMGLSPIVFGVASATIVIVIGISLAYAFRNINNEAAA